MKKQCTHLKKCGFLGNINNQLVRLGWIEMFCSDSQKAQSCKRNQHIKKTGTMPDVCMTPSGKTVQIL